MSLWRCPNCSRRFDDESAMREGYKSPTWGEPGYTFEGCKVCCPTADEEAAAEDAHWEQRISEERERGFDGI